MSEYAFDYDGWAEAMAEAVGPAWSFGLYKAIAKVMHERKVEQIVRCRDCEFCTIYGDNAQVPGNCRKWSRAVYDFDKFCSDGTPRKFHAAN